MTRNFLTLFMLCVLGTNPVFAETTAERLVALFHSTTDYPSCRNEACIQSIKAKRNTVIAEYVLPFDSTNMSQDKLSKRAEFADSIRPGVIRDLCGSAQKNFPDRSMKWVSHYYTKDGAFLGSVLISMADCLQ